MSSAQQKPRMIPGTSGTGTSAGRRKISGKKGANKGSMVRRTKIQQRVPKRKESKSAKAGIFFPAGRITRNLREGRYADRFSGECGVYAAAVLEWLTYEILDMAADTAKDHKRKRIAPRHIQLAVKNDIEIEHLLQGVIISEGGVMPKIEDVLLPKKKPTKAVAAAQRGRPGPPR